MQNELKKGAGKGVAIVAAAAAAIAGAYFLYGKQDKKTKKKIRSWALKAKAEVMDGIERAKEMNEDVYNALVDKVATKYEQVKNVDSSELQDMVADMKKHWKSIQKGLKLPGSK